MLGDAVRRTGSKCCADAESGGGDGGSLTILLSPWYPLELLPSMLLLVEDMADEILSKPTAAGDGLDSDAGLTNGSRTSIGRPRGSELETKG